MQKFFNVKFSDTTIGVPMQRAPDGVLIGPTSKDVRNYLKKNHPGRLSAYDKAQAFKARQFQIIDNHCRKKIN